MDKDIVDIICCPICKKDLILKIIKNRKRRK
jgi:uncharacterized protein YbaR (Trm112 family)